MGGRDVQEVSRLKAKVRHYPIEKEREMKGVGLS